MTATKRPLRKSLLLKVSSLFALLSVASALEDSEDMRRRLGDRQREQDIRIRERFLVEEDCIHVIASFVQGTGNVDPVFGSSDFTRTNAKAMCVSESLYQSLINSPEVLFVELDAPVTTAQYTYSNGEAIPWGADRVLQSVWDEIPLPDEGGEIALCVVDSGLLVDHDDIPYVLGHSNIMGMEFDLPPGVSWNLPVFWAYHGTHLVGSMLAEGFNGIGIRGVIPNNARVKLMIARVFGDEALSSARTSTIEKAVEWCVDNGASVINLSLASESPSYNSQRLYASMFNDENVLIVAASGNQGSSDLAFPAAYDHVLSVGSVDEDLSRSQFSQYGQTLDLVAPGGETYSTVPSSGLFDDEATRFDAGPMAFTPVPNNLISGELFDCGLGDVVCAGAVNQVCLIEHALGLPYVNLAENCELGGGVGLVVYPGENVDLGNAAMDLSYTGTIPVVTVSRASGIELLTRSGRLASISFMVPAYRTVSGTSMSAAHVSALSIRLWGARPSCTNTQIRAALEETALDLGAAGRDDFFGNGLVQGLAAYHYLLDQPEPCGIPGGSNGFGQSGLEELGNPDRPVSDMKRPDSVHVAKTQHRICDPIEHPFCKDGTSPPSNRRLRGQKLSHRGNVVREE